MTTLSSRLYSVAVGRSPLRLDVSRALRAPVEKIPTALAEVWEKYAPEDWQGGQCPFYYEGCRKPLPSVDIQDVNGSSGPSRAYDTLTFLLENPQAAMTAFSLVQEASARLLAWSKAASVAGKTRGQRLWLAMPTGLAFATLGQGRDASPGFDPWLSLFLQRTRETLPRPAGWSSAMRFLPNQGEATIKELARLYEAMTEAALESPRIGTVLFKEPGSLKNPYEPLLRLPKGILFEGFAIPKSPASVWIKPSR